MSIYTNVRLPLKEALDSVEDIASVYPMYPEAAVLPFVAIMPDVPYIEPNLIGSSAVRGKINFQLALVVEPYDNDAGMDNLEQLIVRILAVIPTGYTIGAVSNPMPVVLQSGTNGIACEISVSTQFTESIGD